MALKLFDLRSRVYDDGWHECIYINETRCLYRIYINEKVGSYRGEDSGAYYPEYEQKTIQTFNIAPLFDEFIDETEKLIIGRGYIKRKLKDIVEFAMGGDNLHSDHLWLIYDFLSRRKDLEKFII